MFVLLDIWTKAAYSVFEIFTPLLFMDLEVFKEKSKQKELKNKKR
jgi:hypothetical protein